MGNIKRYYTENAAYFLTAVTFDRIELFKERMHILMHPQGEYNFSYIMKMIKGSFARKVNKINQNSGALWQKGFYDEVVRNSLDLVNKLEYMHNNPVKANLVTSPEEYEYSSHNHYFNTSYSSNPIIEIDKPEL